MTCTLDNVISGIIQHLEREHGGSARAAGIALRLRFRLGHLRATGEWRGLDTNDSGIHYPHHQTEPFQPPRGGDTKEPS